MMALKLKWECIGYYLNRVKVVEDEVAGADKLERSEGSEGCHLGTIGELWRPP